MRKTFCIFWEEKTRKKRKALAFFNALCYNDNVIRMTLLRLIHREHNDESQKNHSDSYKVSVSYPEKCDIAIILISHDLDSVYKYADNVILLNKKILKQGNHCPSKIFYHFIVHLF